MAYAALMKKRESGDNQALGGTGALDDVDAGTYNDSNGNGSDYSWWWSPTGMALRYTIIILLFALLILLFLGSYYHARRRLHKGLTPKPYHAWMVRKAHRRRSPHYNPYHQQQQQHHPDQGYPMQEYPRANMAPPPAYNPHTAPPPAYQPPEGGSKVLADQNGGRMGVYRAGEERGGQASSRLDQPLPPPGQMGPLPPVPASTYL